jgi:uncharacterized protein with von Willebrand factor type A (vWA) domain
MGGGGSGGSNGPPRPEELTPEQRQQLDDFARQQRELGEKIEELQREAEANNESFEQAMNRSRATIDKGMAKALDKAATNAESIAETAMTWGVTPGQMQAMDPKQRIELARKLNSERFRRIADLFGPMRNLMMSEQRRRTVHTTEEIYDIEIGSSLNRLVPSELLALAGTGSEDDLKSNYEKYLVDADTDGEAALSYEDWKADAVEIADAQELDFMRKFQEHSLMQYAMQGEEKLARGGIIVCEDGSGSMSGERELWAKAVMLCLLHLARQQKRSFRLIHFGSPGQVRTIEFTEPGHFTMDRIMQAAEIFFGGGTDFATPMRNALGYLQDDFARTG